MKKAKQWYSNNENEFFDPDIGQKVYRVAYCRWMSQDEKDLEDARHKAANALAKYFELKHDKKQDPEKVCACLGITCGDYSCPVLWELFLRNYDNELIKFVESIRY